MLLGKMKKDKKKKNKSNNNKKDKNETDSLDIYLASLDLQLVDITGDGACLFRSLIHQIHGTEQHHLQIRSSICDYMQENPDHFIPFLIDESIDHHVQRMRDPTTFGTHLELVAFTHVYPKQIIIYQLDTPAYILSPPNDFDSTLHIVYHSFEHYSSTSFIHSSLHSLNKKQESGKKNKKQDSSRKKGKKERKSQSNESHQH